MASDSKPFCSYDRIGCINVTVKPKLDPGTHHCSGVLLTFCIPVVIAIYIVSVVAELDINPFENTAETFVTSDPRTVQIICEAPGGCLLERKYTYTTGPSRDCAPPRAKDAGVCISLAYKRALRLPICASPAANDGIIVYWNRTANVAALQRTTTTTTTRRLARMQSRDTPVHVVNAISGAQSRLDWAKVRPALFPGHLYPVTEDTHIAAVDVQQDEAERVRIRAGIARAMRRRAAIKARGLQTGGGGVDDIGGGGVDDIGGGGVDDIGGGGGDDIGGGGGDDIGGGGVDDIGGGGGDDIGGGGVDDIGGGGVDDIGGPGTGGDDIGGPGTGGDDIGGPGTGGDDFGGPGTGGDDIGGPGGAVDDFFTGGGTYEDDFFRFDPGAGFQDDYYGGLETLSDEELGQFFGEDFGGAGGFGGGPGAYGDDEWQTDLNPNTWNQWDDGEAPPVESESALNEAKKEGFDTEYSYTDFNRGRPTAEVGISIRSEILSLRDNPSGKKELLRSVGGVPIARGRVLLQHHSSSYKEGGSLNSNPQGARLSTGYLSIATDRSSTFSDDDIKETLSAQNRTSCLWRVIRAVNRTITLPSDAEFIRLEGKNAAVPVPVAAIDTLNDINGDYSTAQVILSGQRSSGTIVKRSWEYILGAAGGFVTIIMGAFAGVAAGIRAFDVIVCGGCLSCGSIEPTEEELAEKTKDGDDGGDSKPAEGASQNTVAPAPAPAPRTTSTNPQTGAKAGFADEV